MDKMVSPNGVSATEWKTFNIDIQAETNVCMILLQADCVPKDYLQIYSQLNMVQTSVKLGGSWLVEKYSFKFLWISYCLET